MEAALKTGIGVVGSFVSWMIGGFGMVFVVLLALMAIDFFTGLMAAAATASLSSRVGRNGFIRKMYVILLVGSVYMIEKSLLGSNGIVGDGIVAAYCILEFLSIIENGGKLGAPIGPLKNIIEVLKQKGGDPK